MIEGGNTGGSDGAGGGPGGPVGGGGIGLAAKAFCLCSVADPARTVDDEDEDARVNVGLTVAES